MSPYTISIAPGRTQQVFSNQGAVPVDLLFAGSGESGAWAVSETPASPIVEKQVVLVRIPPGGALNVSTGEKIGSRVELLSAQPTRG